MAATLGACATTPRCADGAQVAIQDAFYFGTRTPTGVVTRDEWDDFLATTVTPRFPDGLTVYEAAGQWRRADGVVVRESSYVLQVVHPPDAKADRSATDIVDAYRRRFRQDSVLRVKADVCASF